MGDAANSGADQLAEAEARLGEYARDLAEGVTAAIGPWVEASVRRIHEAWSGSCPEEVADAARVAGVEATEAVATRVAEVLAADPDDLASSPLQVVRTATPWPTRVLRDAGVPPVVRDSEAERQFPDDDYDLTPASFAELGPGLGDLGIVWGAAKAHVVLLRRTREGRR